MKSGVCPSCGRALAGGTAVGGLCAACLLQLAKPSATSPGCRVLTVLGQSAGAVSYLAQPLAAGARSLLVLKILDSANASIGDAAHLVTELRHPSIATTHRTGIAPDGRPFLVRDFVAGAALPVFLAGRDCEQTVRAALLADIREALACARERGTWHGRLHENNVIVTGGDTRSRAVVTDFGAAAMSAVDPAVTAIQDVERLDGDSLDRLARLLAAGD